MPSNVRTTWLLWGAILALALGVRLAAAYWWQGRLGAPDAFAFGDSDSYWLLASKVAAGLPFQYGGPEAKLMRMPGYPVMLSPAFLIWGGEPPVVLGRAIGAVAGTLAVAGLMWLAQRLFGGVSGAAAGLLAAVYPGGIATSVFILSEASFCPLLVLQAICWALAVRGAEPSWRRWAIGAGAVSGLAVYSRPSWLLFPLFLTLFGLVLDRWVWRRHLLVGAIAIGLTCLCMVPWWIRSYRYTGHFVLTTLEMGASLYDGLNAEADGGSNMDFKRGFYLAQAKDDPDATPGQFAYRVDQRMRAEAWNWARENPGQVVRLAGVKMMRLWSPIPNAGQFRSSSMRLLVALGYLPLLLGAVYAAWRFRANHWSSIVVIAAPAFYLSTLHLFFVSSIRYRQPAMLLTTVLVGAVVSAWLDREAKPTVKLGMDSS